MKYKLCVGAIFKNESHCLKEWLDHYIHHGVDHFYLINDSSTDIFIDVLKPYIDKEIVELYEAKFDYYLGRQRDMYNFYLLPRLKDTEWLLICDLDEFMWSPLIIDLTKLLDQCKHIGQIQVEHTIFGSNGHIKQPSSLIKYFTKRSKDQPTKSYGNVKYFVNSNFKFSSLNVHHATFVDENDEKNHFKILESEYFILNHYCCQSKNFWMNVKCTRGDADNYRVRTEKDFDEVNLNDIEDLRLCEQNKNISIDLNKYQNNKMIYKGPIKNIPSQLIDKYTLNDKIPVLEFYFEEDNERFTEWNKELIERFINKLTKYNILKNIQEIEYYTHGCLYHIKAIEKYPVKNKKVVIIGSQVPWIEAICINEGAKEILTIEYNIPKCDHQLIKCISYSEFEKSDEKYDYIISYSSVEHSGLGRYGDNLDPNGDIKTMKTIYNSLNNGGIMLLGVPIGKDALAWNAHRIYGEVRLPLLLGYFEILEWIEFDPKIIYDSKLTKDVLHQPIIVLKK